MKLTPIEKRLLGYLDQRGKPVHRSTILQDLASPESRWGSGIVNGSNGAAPLIVGKWASRLIKNGFVVTHYAKGFYRSHEITGAGKKALRESI